MPRQKYGTLPVAKRWRDILNTHQRVMEMLEMSEDEKFARMVVALETIAGCMTAEAMAKQPIKPIKPVKSDCFDLEYRLCSSCGLIVVHEVTRDYRHCTMCGKLSAVD